LTARLLKNNSLSGVSAAVFLNPGPVRADAWFDPCALTRNHTQIMPAIDEISEALVSENIARAVRDVFLTMLNHDLTFDGAELPAAGEKTLEYPKTRKFSIPQVVGIVGFIGDVNGLVYLHFDERFAALCTGRILGLSEAELAKVDEDTVNDAIGELTNMVVGGFKVGLCEAGYPCRLTIPSVLRGRDVRIEATSAARRHAYRFNWANHQLTTDVLVKAGD
jgi:chemotaxis protein CheX